MNPSEELKRRLGQCPFVAIIRGIIPDQAEAIGAALSEAGIVIIEVPLNSPNPLFSIEKLAKSLGDRALIGAGTVLSAGDVARVKDAGGRIIVSPDTNAEVIAASAAAGLVSTPGYFTPSEAFTALRAGAHGLKFFPAEAGSPAVVKAQRAVLPKDVPLLVVGGVKPDSLHSWLDAGATGFGLGGGLYVPGQSAQDTAAKAKAYVDGLFR
ncbi:MAG: 2-dehydro-3-deoxy-6-phosphogalactonate aldolase [Allosphingosinicella sp.]